MQAGIAISRQILAASWGQALAAIVQLVALRFYTGALGPEAFGLAMLAMGALILVDGLGSLPFGQVLAQVLKDNPDREQRVALGLGLGLRFLVWIGLLCSVGVAAAVFVLGPVPALMLAIIAAGFCVTETLRGPAQIIAMMERRFSLISVWFAADAVATLAFTLIAIRLTGASPAALVLGTMTARMAVTCVMAQPALGKFTSWRIDRVGAQLAAPRALKFGWPIASMGPVTWLGQFTDRYVLAATGGLAQAGVLAALTGAVSRPYAIVSAGLTNFLRPDLLDQAAGRKPVHARPLRSWLLLALAIGLAGIAAFALVGGWIAAFLIDFPTPGLDAAMLLVAIAFGQMLMMMTQAFENCLLAQGRSRAILGAQSAMIIAGIPIIALGAMAFGALGAALGRACFEGIKLLASAWMVLRVRHLAPPRQVPTP